MRDVVNESHPTQGGGVVYVHSAGFAVTWSWRGYNMRFVPEHEYDPDEFPGLMCEAVMQTNAPGTIAVDEWAPSGDVGLCTVVDY